jgi:FixJ family two-component response regulator
MPKNQLQVLVIDDDEVVLAAVADLLEAAQFTVSCHASPAGAADMAAAGPALAAVVLDLNMPIMRGDNVARMFLSRASLRDLPIVFLSGETPAALNSVRMKMPNVRVVAKADMETALVPALREAIAERARRTQPRGWGSEPSAAVAAEAGAVTRFYAQLGAEMDAARDVWRDVRAGKLQSVLKLAAALRALQGEADRNGLMQLGQLLRAVEPIALALHHGSKLRPSAESGVQMAIDALSAVARDQSVGAGFKLDAITDALRRAALELRVKPKDG